MNRYIDIIANKLTLEKKNVIIYGADADALLVLHALKDRYHTQPTCLCDNDMRKWHKSLSEIEILSPDEVFSRFSNAYFYIASGFYKFQIISYLISSGIEAEKILNYEPVEKRLSCLYLESYIICGGHRLNFCCSDFGKNISPSIPFNGNYDIAVREFITYRDQLIYDLNNGIPTPCDGCPCIKEDWYMRERRIVMYNDGEAGICNFNCCYCNSSAKTSGNTNDDINTQKLLDVFSAHQLLSDELHTIISCGEVSVHPHRSDIYKTISGFRNTICTNASICDQGILQLLELGYTDLVVSVDAGTRSTFAEVKGYDLFNKVCENLQRYGTNGVVKLKYIFLPGINDNKDDIDGFVELCNDIGAELVQISYNLNTPPVLTEKTIKMVKYLIDQLSANKHLYRVISDVINKALNKEKASG